VAKKKGRKKPPRPAYKLRSAGVADRGKFIRGCMAVLGAVFLLLALGFVWSWFFAPKS